MKRHLLIIHQLGLLFFVLSGCQKHSAINDTEEPVSLPRKEYQQGIKIEYDELPLVEQASQTTGTSNETLSWYYVGNKDHKPPL